MLLGCWALSVDAPQMRKKSSRVCFLPARGNCFEQLPVHRCARATIVTAPLDNVKLWRHFPTPDDNTNRTQSIRGVQWSFTSRGMVE